MNTRLLFTHALSPLHAGTGQGVGVIDLPIAREKATGIPYLPGSSLKGSLRDVSLTKHGTHSTDTLLVFGPDTGNAADHAGSAQFSDQRLLLLPVRSLRGTFAWVTSPYVLQRFAREAAEVQRPETLQLPKNVPSVPGDQHCLIPKKYSSVIKDGAKVVLEDLDPSASETPEVDAWVTFLADAIFSNDSAWNSMLKERFCMVSDNMFRFLLNTATEVVARIKIQDDSKTVQRGGLWYEESLPTESILSGIVVIAPVENKNKQKLSESAIVQHLVGLTETSVQFGGKATVGRGICRLALL